MNLTFQLFLIKQTDARRTCLLEMHLQQSTLALLENMIKLTYTQ